MTVSPEIPAQSSLMEPIRVMIVDDSAVIRGFLTRFINSDSETTVTASVANGQLALRTMEKMSFDVVVLDINMPVMDGMTALPLILKADPNVQIIVASTLTLENAAVTIEALEMGAAECMLKPSSRDLVISTSFRDSLIEKIKALGMLARKKRKGSSVPAPYHEATKTAAVGKAVEPVPTEKKFSVRREIMKIAPDVIAIGSSTGGPQALMQFFFDLKGGVRQPIFVTQHMPPTFTTILAEHISKKSGLICTEAAEGEVVQGGHIYLAPGNFHMTVKESGGRKVISLNQDPPESYCRPAIDPMLRSIISAYGKKILAVIFTGMGSDGLRGCQNVVDAGGIVLAQDEATSVVWGMPGCVAMAGICTQVLPLEQMAGAVREYADLRGGS